NLTLGCRNKISDDEIINICSRLGLQEKIERLPEKYDTIINEKINFSGGEAQRLAIARAYLKKAPINIFDEITSSLDEFNFHKVMEIIDEIKQDSMIIIFTHKLEMLESAKKIINIEKFSEKIYKSENIAMKSY
ncbi:MAG: ABC transporter ATP-binding protein/permease, partial [Lactobacillales bacterium]|nr:ABC transporter ATP-binding protein/permease [Lactobacillales bacterium]